MRVQLNFILILILVLIHISFSFPDRHERNKCRPPNCHRRDPSDSRDNSGKKIPDIEEVPEEGNNALKLEYSTTTTTTTAKTTTGSIENIIPVPIQNITTTDEINDLKLNTTNSTTTTSTSTNKPGHIEITMLNIIRPGPGAGAGVENVTDENHIISNTIPSVIIKPNGEIRDSLTGEIQIPVEVRIIPPSRDELGGLTGHCPKPFKYHNETGMCFIPGQIFHHPCGEFMEFYGEPGTSVYGDCDCKRYVGCDYRPLIYYTKTKRCYHIFDQGPCKSDEWFILGNKFEPICTKRICPPNENNTTTTTTTKSWFLFDGKCYQLSTQGFCNNPKEIVQYGNGKLIPFCSLNSIKTPPCSKTRNLSVGGSLPCSPGHKNTGSGSCSPVVGF